MADLYNFHSQNNSPQNHSIITMQKKSLPLVYSCSGCSNVAQLANQVALELNRQKAAEMSCIAGVGGNVKPLVKLATSGRPIIALDGCALHCVRNCLQQHAVVPDLHYTLTDDGFRKREFSESSPESINAICQKVILELGITGANNAKAGH